MRKYHIFFVLSMLALASCSTTKFLEDGDQLYVGIKEITYNVDPRDRKLTKAEKRALLEAHEQRAGVITAMDDAYNTVRDAISGGHASADSTLQNQATANVHFEGRGAARAEARALQVKEEQLQKLQTDIEAIVACSPNGSLFGSSSVLNPAKIGLRVYNKYYQSKSKFGKWMLKTFGTEPVLISSVTPDTRIKVATTQLHNLGYFRGYADYRIVPKSNPKKAKIAYDIHTGPLYLIDSLKYASFGGQADSLLRKTRRERFLKKGAAFSSANLVAERQRIERLFRDNGYYYFSQQNVAYQADTVNHPQYVSLRVNADTINTPGVMRPWKVGNIHITLHDNETDVIDTVRTFRRLEYAFHGKKAPLSPMLWLRAIDHRPGKIFSISDQESTLSKLSAMNILSQISVDYLPASFDENCDTLDMYVTAKMDRLFESAFEVNATLKSNQLAGPGVSYELAKKNAFGAGEKVSWKIFGSYEFNVSGGFGAKINSYELGTELALSFPRLIGLKRRSQRFPATTKIAATIDWKNRAGYFNMLRFGVGMQYNWYKNPLRKHELTAFDFSYDHLFSVTDAFNEAIWKNPSLMVSMREQFVPSISYTYTHTTSSVKAPLWMQFHIKEAGNLFNALYSAVPGYSWNEKGKTIFKSPFAQFVKLTAEVHKTWTFSQRISLATRFYAGSIFTYGNSSGAPYAEQFYVGGANSVRGFPARSIGPGGYRSADRKYSYIDQVGDFKLEANLELRAKIVGDLHGAVFVDAGNVWLIHGDPLRPNSKLTLNNLKRMAVGTGLGVRYDLSFLVVRLDLGVGLHAPYDTDRTGFYNLQKFTDGLALHLAIGYPF